jgi:aspartate/methionine/tyrosine aminotransferase
VKPAIPRRLSGVSFPPFDVLNHRASALRLQGHNVISLGQAVPGFGPPPSAIAAARAALSEPATHRYAADAGLLSLREALCERFAADRGVDSTPADLIITAGGNQAFMAAAMTLIDPGDEVVVAAPFFVNHEMALRVIGAVPIEAPLRESAAFAPQWSDIEGHLTPRTRAVVLCSPSNPTGAVAAAGDLAHIARELASRGIFLITDETYLHFVHAGRPCSAASLERWRDNVVVVGTFSKSFGMTGWRVGYLLADRAICEQALKVQDAMIICAPVISQIAVEAAVRTDWNYALSFADGFRERRAALAGTLATIPGLHWSPADGGFFAFVRVDDCLDSVKLANDILDRVHVVTIPGATFGRSGEGFLRLSYGASSVEELSEAGARLRRFFASPPN